MFLQGPYSSNTDASGVRGGQDAEVTLDVGGRGVGPDIEALDAGA